MKLHLNRLIIITIICISIISISNVSNATGLKDIIQGGTTFLKRGDSQGEIISTEELRASSTFIFKILLGIGVTMAAVVGIILGIQFMLGSIEEQAKVKEGLVAYVVACSVIFGAFTIWKMTINIATNVEKEINDIVPAQDIEFAILNTDKIQTVEPKQDETLDFDPTVIMSDDGTMVEGYTVYENGQYVDHGGYVKEGFTFPGSIAGIAKLEAAGYKEREEMRSHVSMKDGSDLVILTYDTDKDLSNGYVTIYVKDYKKSKTNEQGDELYEYHIFIDKVYEYHDKDGKVTFKDYTGREISEEEVKKFIGD